MNENSAKRGAWGSRIGFLITTWFAAIGIGNMWRFPFRCAMNGGGAFLVPYLIFILTVSLPAVTAEAAAGKYAHSDAVGSMGKVGGLRGGGVMMLFLNLFGAYYMVVVSQSLLWFGYSIANKFSNQTSEAVWEAFQANKGLCFGIFFVTMILSVIPPYFGIKAGIERVAKYVGGFAIIVIFLGAIRAITMPGAIDGVVYYLTPDWGRMFTASTMTAALSQAYFTFGAGWGWYLILSSYLSKTSDVGFGHLTTGFADTFFALMAGFAIIPTLFASGYNAETVSELGSSTAYIAMPKVFDGMPGGYIISILFFAALFFAAYSCAYVLVEVVGSFFIDSMGMERKKGTLLAAILLLICGTPAALSSTVMDSLDTIFGCYLLPLLVTVQVISFGYRFGANRLRVAEYNMFGNGYLGKWMTYLYLYWVPVVNIFLMIYFAATMSGPDMPWYFGWKGFGLILIITLAVVIGFDRADRAKGIPYDGQKAKA